MANYGELEDRSKVPSARLPSRGGCSEFFLSLHLNGPTRRVRIQGFIRPLLSITFSSGRSLGSPPASFRHSQPILRQPDGCSPKSRSCLSPLCLTDHLGLLGVQCFAPSFLALRYLAPDVSLHPESATSTLRSVPHHLSSNRWTIFRYFRRIVCGGAPHRDLFPHRASVSVSSSLYLFYPFHVLTLCLIAF